MVSNVPIPPAPETLLRVRELTKHYVRGGLWHGRVTVAAVEGVNFEILAGQTLALVGESGSGKSTVARCISRIEKPDSGQIWIGSQDITHLDSHRLLPLHTQVQMVFQDAVTAMNPRFTAAEAVEEPLRILGKNASERSHAALAAMDEVGVPRTAARRSVMEFSGGQRQRLAIARAIILRPKLLVLDEALTGLDLSTQAQIANLLLDLQVVHSLTYLLISHDLALVARMADTVTVMAAGRIVETGPAAIVAASPKHERTVRLLASAHAARAGLAATPGGSA